MMLTLRRTAIALARRRRRPAFLAGAAPPSQAASFGAEGPNRPPPRLFSSAPLGVLSRPRTTTAAAAVVPADDASEERRNGVADPGLFSVPGLHAPSDFLTLASNAIRECDSLRSSLSSVSPTNTPPGVSKKNHAIEILHTLDDISNVVCSVIDAAEMCRSVHSSEAWRNAAGNAFRILSEYIGDLNGDVKLYEALTVVTSDAETFRTLTEEQRRMATQLRAEFERDGIHLPDADRAEVGRLQNSVTELETLFSSNVTHSRSYLDVDADQVERIIPRHVIEASVPQSDVSNDNGGKITISTEAHIANTLGKYSPNPSLRKDVFLASHTSCKENLDVLDALIARRHETSVKLGFESYADRFLRDKMAKKPKNVSRFLESMEGTIRNGGQFKREMELIADAKRKVERDSDGTVEPWDVPFYTGLLRARDGFDGRGLAGHLTLDNAIGGMGLLVSKLFGMTMRESPMKPSERWDLDNGNDEKGDMATTTTAGGGVRKFELEHEKEGHVGTMYLDLHPRPGKYAHAAHFTVRCGCVGRPDRATGSTAQTPVVALVCNLSPPTSSSSDSRSHLSHAEFETLYHEFGHALHSLLSRTSFQHLSGTRAAMDFVETPSHLIENYVWDANFLKLAARHCDTGAPLSDDAIRALLHSRHAFRSTEVQTQIVYSLFDQALFGVPPAGQDRSEPSWTMRVFADLHRRNGVPYADGTHWHTRFGHLVTYGAGYYGYLYSQVFAADIWRRTFVTPGDTLSRSAGENIRRKMLVHGGAKDPDVMLRDVLGGDDPRVDSYFESMKL